MAQIKLTKKMSISIILFLLFVVIVIVFLNSRSSTVTTDQPEIYQVKLADEANESYASQIKVKPGKYTILVKGPFFTQPETINIGLLQTKKIDTPSYENSERGIEQVLEERLKDYGIFYTTVNECQEIEKLYFACRYHRASSTNAIEAKYTNYKWILQSDESKITNKDVLKFFKNTKEVVTQR
jgi:hypothetical protein